MTTPAPWIADKQDVWSGEKSDKLVCVCYGLNEKFSDAKLIAAAHDLLEALIACDEAMEYMSEYDIPITLPQQVKDAIAKATQ